MDAFNLWDIINDFEPSLSDEVVQAHGLRNDEPYYEEPADPLMGSTFYCSIGGLRNDKWGYTVY